MPSPAKLSALARARKRTATSVKVIARPIALRQKDLDRGLRIAQHDISQRNGSQRIAPVSSRPSKWLRGNILAYPTRIPALAVAKAKRDVPSAPHQQAPILTLQGSPHSIEPGVQRTSHFLARRQVRRQQKIRQELSPEYNPLQWKGYSTIDDLRHLLGLSESGTSDESPRNAVLVSIDTESERQGLSNKVVEVGITILRVDDVLGFEAGPYAENWLSKTEHRHIVVDITRRPKLRMQSSIFGRSIFLNPIETKRMIRAILRACMRNEPLPEQPAADAAQDPGPYNEPDNSALLCLVGQSIRADVDVLSGRPLHLDLRSQESLAGARFSSTFDTFALTQRAKSLGAPLSSGALGPAIRQLGAHPRYHDPGKATVLGVHNASNDAAYTMMLLVLWAVRWKEVVPAVGEAAQVLHERSQNLSKEDAQLQQRYAEQDTANRSIATKQPRKGDLYKLWQRAGLICALAGGTIGIPWAWTLFDWP